MGVNMKNSGMQIVGGKLESSNKEPATCLCPGHLCSIFICMSSICRCVAQFHHEPGIRGRDRKKELSAGYLQQVVGPGSEETARKLFQFERRSSGEDFHRESSNDRTLAVNAEWKLWIIADIRGKIWTFITQSKQFHSGNKHSVPRLEVSRVL